MFVAMETGILQDSICPSSVCVKQSDNIMVTYHMTYHMTYNR